MSSQWYLQVNKTWQTRTQWCQPHGRMSSQWYLQVSKTWQTRTHDVRNILIVYIRKHIDYISPIKRGDPFRPYSMNNTCLVIEISQRFLSVSKSCLTGILESTGFTKLHISLLIHSLHKHSPISTYCSSS